MQGARRADGACSVDMAWRLIEGIASMQNRCYVPEYELRLARAKWGVPQTDAEL